MTLRLPRSLFGQVVLSQALLMAAIATALPIMLSHLLNLTADRFEANRLAQDAQAIAAGARPGSGGLESPGFRTAYLFRTAQGRQFAIVDAAGKTRVHGPYALPLPAAVIARGSAPVFFKYGRYDALSMPIADPGKAIQQWVVVAQDRTVPEEIVDDVVGAFLGRFLWIIPVSLLASLAIGLIIVRRVTNNFRRASQAADAISENRIDVRLKPAELPAEAWPLVNAMNRALDRLEAGYRFQGEFASNVAHELRTPLALISLRAEGLDPSPERDLIQSEVDRANHVVHQLMELAAIDRRYPMIEPIDSCALAREVVSVTAPLVFQSGRVIAFIEPEATPPAVLGVPGLIHIALTNLIDNAIRHTPAGTCINVCVEQDGVIAVEDDGPGVTVQGTAKMRRTYRRAGTNRSDSAGLGLSIVERIMTACGGTLDIDNRPSGGTRAAIRLAQAAEAWMRKRPMP